MHLFRVWKGERAGAQQRLIAKGCLSRRSDLIEFKDAQQEAWKGLFQEQRVHCWDAEMQQGLEARAGEPRCEQCQQISRGSSGGTAGLPRGQGAASCLAEGCAGVREGSVPAPLAEIHPGGRGRGLGCGGIVGGTFVLFFCLQHISVFLPNY